MVREKRGPLRAYLAIVDRDTWTVIQVGRRQIVPATKHGFWMRWKGEVKFYMQHRGRWVSGCNAIPSIADRI